MITYWTPAGSAPAFCDEEWVDASRQVRESAHIIEDGASRVGVGIGGEVVGDRRAVNGYPSFRVLGTLPPLYPEWLGDRAFGEAHGVRFPYVAGEMANGIATTAAGGRRWRRAGCSGSSARPGSTPERVEAGVDEIAARARTGGAHLGREPHPLARTSPSSRRRSPSCTSRAACGASTASAFMGLTPASCATRATGFDADAGRAHRAHAPRVREGLAARGGAAVPVARAAADARSTCSPRGQLTRDEADAGRGTCRSPRTSPSRPTPAATPTTGRSARCCPIILALRDELAAQHGYARADPRSARRAGSARRTRVAAAFALGAAYVLTGSVNQARVESGLSRRTASRCSPQAEHRRRDHGAGRRHVRAGVKVQVLQARHDVRGARARSCTSSTATYAVLEAMPPRTRARSSRSEMLRRRASTRSGRRRERSVAARDPRELDARRARPEAPMALVFRWYLGPVEPVGDRRRPERGGSTTRSGAGPRWARSTPGSGARSSRRRTNRTVVADRAQPARRRGGRSRARSSCAATACPCPPRRSISARVAPGLAPELR